MNKQCMWVFAAVAILFIGCNQTAVYEQYEGISNEQWEMQDTLCFSVPITDTTGHYNVLLHIRNTELYPYQNLWLFTRSTAPDRTIASDTLECYLADNSGKWINSSLLSIHEMPLLYMNNIRFPKEGMYTFHIVHGMRDSILQGISHIGLSVEPISKTKYVEE